jgi:hypothetical protein
MRADRTVARFLLAQLHRANPPQRERDGGKERDGAHEDLKALMETRMASEYDHLLVKWHLEDGAPAGGQQGRSFLEQPRSDLEPLYLA